MGGGQSYRILNTGEPIDKSSAHKYKSFIHIRSREFDICYSKKHMLMIDSLNIRKFRYTTNTSKSIYAMHPCTRYKIVLDVDDSKRIKIAFDKYIFDIEHVFKIKVIIVDNKYKIHIGSGLRRLLNKYNFIVGKVSIIWRKSDANYIDIYNDGDKISADIQYMDVCENMIFDIDFYGDESELKAILNKIMYRVLKMAVRDGRM